jgi:hypothetical protein
MVAACGRSDSGSSGSSCGGVPLKGATAWERAVHGVEALDLPAHSEITVLSEDISLQAAVVTKDAFEAASGIKLKTQEAPFLKYALVVLNSRSSRYRWSSRPRSTFRSRSSSLPISVTPPGCNGPPQAALRFVAMVPTLITTLAIQRLLIGGMTLGAVKG